MGRGSRQNVELFRLSKRNLLKKYASNITRPLKTHFFFSTFYFPCSSLQAQTFLLLLSIQQEKMARGCPSVLTTPTFKRHQQHLQQYSAEAFISPTIHKGKELSTTTGVIPETGNLKDSLLLNFTVGTIEKPRSRDDVLQLQIYQTQRGRQTPNQSRVLLYKLCSLGSAQTQKKS